MRILLIGFGSRGDVQPLIPLGNGLKAAGYEVAITAGSNFQKWIEDEGFVYEPSSLDIEALMSGDSGKEWVENSSQNLLKEAQNIRRMLDEVSDDSADELIRIAENYDVLVSGLAVFHGAESIAKKFNKKHITVLFAPMHPTSNAAACIEPAIPNRSFFLNRISGYMGHYFTHYIYKGMMQAVRKKLDQSPMSYWEYIRAYDKEVPALYGLSPLVMPRPNDWGEQIHVTGYWFDTVKEDWKPSQALCDFLDAGKPPVYIGFGSMSNKNPEATTKIMIDALQQTGQRGIIYSGWAGLKADELPEDIFMLDFAPHDWLFPRMAAVIHHGGAGTTGAGLKAGVPSAVVSHMADQPYWGRRIQELGVAAPLIRRHELTTKRLADNIRLMVNDSDMQKRAADLGQRIRQEDGVGNAVAIFNQILGQ